MTPSEVMNDYMAKKKKGKRLWWLKLPKDFFTSNNVIKKMRKLPGGDLCCNHSEAPPPFT